MKNLIDNTGKMTSLVIAEITNKRHADVMTAIKKMEVSWLKVGERIFSLTSYIDSQNKARPMYELTKTECLYIATKFNDEARAKLILRWAELEEQKQLTPAQIQLQQAQLLVEQERKIQEHDERLNLLEAKTNTRPEYFTIAAYASLNGISVNVTAASQLGRKASKICKERNLMTDTTPCQRYGTVKMYPKSILKEVFETTIINKPIKNSDVNDGRKIKINNSN